MGVRGGPSTIFLQRVTRRGSLSRVGAVHGADFGFFRRGRLAEFGAHESQCVDLVELGQYPVTGDSHAVEES